MIAFFDANALIYLIEGGKPFSTRIGAELALLAQTQPRILTAVSRLSWLECRVGPEKAADTARLAKFDAFFGCEDLVWVELSRAVVELATAIRVRHGLRTSDALQAACCLQLGADHLFLTGDAVFQRVRGLKVRTLL